MHHEEEMVLEQRNTKGNMGDAVPRFAGCRYLEQEMFEPTVISQWTALIPGNIYFCCSKSPEEHQQTSAHGHPHTAPSC